MLSGQAPLLLSRLHCTSGVCSTEHRLGMWFLTAFTEMADPTRLALRTPLRLGGLLGTIGGFLLAYQNSSGTHGSFHQSASP